MFDSPANRAPRDHGGDLARATGRHGGAAGDWLDISTGIKRPARPIPPLPDPVWRQLETALGAALA